MVDTPIQIDVAESSGTQPDTTDRKDRQKYLNLLRENM
jgi:hypothetical protein